jgi:hypothetical protein
MWTALPDKHFFGALNDLVAAVICPASVDAEHISAGLDEVR